MPSVATLPPELFDIIIGHTQDDIDELATCGLVCRSWLAASRHYIFTGKPVSLRPGNVLAFIQLVIHPSSTILPYIQSLELLSTNSVRRGSSDSETDWDSDWLDPVVGILANLPCVTELLIQNINWGRMNPLTRSALLAGFQALAHLEIWAAQFDSVSHVVQLVCSKPLLQILSVDDLGWDDPSFDPALNVPGALHSLRLSNCYKRDILDWIASHDSLPPIHHIQLARCIPKTPIPSLEFSSLDAGGDAEDFCSRVDLSHNFGLHTIILDKFINYSVYQFSSAVAWIPELLSRTPNLMEVSFGVAIRDLRELHPEEDPIDWEALDSLFCHSHFPHLRTLRFWVSGIVALDSVSDAIARCLPLSNERRMLRFHRGVPRMVEI
ncbi:hypothetical protein B0H13DRAFT_2308849 [Mycena leptocephala]|nr:hypothetical protein B0H13DRAFT_2308849 [Mycena leptocephala]